MWREEKKQIKIKRYESHGGNVEVRCVDVESRWQTHIDAFLILLAPSVPIPMKEWKQKEAYFASDVGGVHFKEEAEVIH